MHQSPHMDEVSNYPAVSFTISSDNVAQDVGVATSVFNELMAELSKNKIPFELHISSGSIEFSLQILIDFIRQIAQDPAGAVILGGAVSGAVGTITQKLLDRKDLIKNIKENRAWRVFTNLRLSHNKNLDKKLDSISFDGLSIRVGFRGKDGNLVYESYDWLPTRSKDDVIQRGEVENLIVSNLEHIDKQDLILLALRLREILTATDIRNLLESWGRPSGQWFYASGMIGNLVNKGLVKKVQKTSKTRGPSGYRITKKGLDVADSLIEYLRKNGEQAKPPFILQRIVDRGVRKIRLFYVTENIERCTILFNNIPLVWDRINKTEKTIGEGGGGNVIIPETIFDGGGTVTVVYNGQRFTKKYNDLVEAEP